MAASVFVAKATTGACKADADCTALVTCILGC